MKYKQSFKVTTYIQPDKLRQLIDGINSAVTLGFGNYDSVLWYSAPGIEEFRPLKGANPTEGKCGELSSLPSVKLEFTLPDDASILEKAVDEGIRKHHPWEEPVIVVEKVLTPLKTDRNA